MGLIQPTHSWVPVVGIEACVCGFGNGLCNWTSSGSHQWVRHSGSTASGGTGPSGAHQGNYYVYVEVWCLDWRVFPMTQIFEGLRLAPSGSGPTLWFFAGEENWFCFYVLWVVPTLLAFVPYSLPSSLFSDALPLLQTGLYGYLCDTSLTVR
jgi:hypothetical protein